MNFIKMFLAVSVFYFGSVISAAVYPAPPGHPLVIKTYPAVENIQSNVYEVFQEPYNFDVRTASAVAIIQGEGESTVSGEIVFMQPHPPTGPVVIRGNITGLSPGKHGLHIHQAGDLRHGCGKLGNHYNPFLHGGPRDSLRHVGDLGNIETKEDGIAEFEYIDPVLSLTRSLRNIVGRAIVITAQEDDLGRGGTADSITTGSSGKPLGCGVIGYIK